MSNVIDLFTRQAIVVEPLLINNHDKPESVLDLPIRKEKGLYLGRKLSMPFYSKLALFKASNVYFDIERTQAWSYGWWRFVDFINGYVVFNTYRYSSSTSRHQSKVLKLLRELDIKIDFWLEVPGGLQDGLASAKELYLDRIARLGREMDKPRSKKEKNIERLYDIEECHNALTNIELIENSKLNEGA